MVAKFLVTFQWGEMAQDPDTIAAARRALVRWAASTGSALIDAGAPIRSTATLTRRGTEDDALGTAFMGWSVIDAADRNAAFGLLKDHPLLGLGARIQVNEPI